MNVGSPGVPWSAQQREWLQALAHDVLMPVGSMPEPEVVAEPQAVKPSAPAKLVSSASPLLRALARAADRNEQDAEFLRALPDVASLRGSPAARRALWPRLRALRKRSA